MGTAAGRNRLFLKILAFVGMLWINSPPVHGLCADFTGVVVSILDGDTIEVLHNTYPERIRLSGIDCPEKGQAYGQKAKQAASALAFEKKVTVQTHGTDRYQRILGDVILPDGMNLNHELVKQGWCWWYRKYAPKDTELERLEAEARDAKKGLWVDAAPISPWVYRKARRGQALNRSDLVPLGAETVGSVSTRGPILLEAIEKESASSASASHYPVIGNRKRIYHRPDCPNYSEIVPRNRITFNMAAEAQQARYRVAGNCP